jgi:hypothetical protein
MNRTSKPSEEVGTKSANSRGWKFQRPGCLCEWFANRQRHDFGKCHPAGSEIPP